MKKWLVIAMIIIATLLASYLIWFIWPQEKLSYSEPILEPELLVLNSSLCPHLLIGVQAEMYAEDYQSSVTFYQKLNAHLKSIKESIGQAESRIIVFPEHIGTWLVAAGERNSIYTAENVTEAMITMIMSHPMKYKFYRFNFTEAKDNNKANIFRMKAQHSAEIYQEVFSRVAKEHEAYIIAGSIVLPSPTVKNGMITIGTGPLYNVSFMFHPNGNVDKVITTKSFPIADEQDFCHNGDVNTLPSIMTPAGSLATLICADSWYPESYVKVKELNSNIIAVPSFSVGTNIMSDPWMGYNGFDFPNDVDKSDKMKITEEAAWDKYALSGRINSTYANIGINVFLRGKLWDMNSNGRSKVVINGEDHKVGSDGASVIIVCIPN